MNKTDRYVFHQLCDALLERAARLVTASIAGCLLETDSGHHCTAPVLILMEGSTYVHFTRLKEKILHHVNVEITQKQDLHVVLKEMNDAVTYGTAYAATAQ